MKNSWAPLSFALGSVTKLLCSCLCLLDAIPSLSYMLWMEIFFNDFLVGK